MHYSVQGFKNGECVLKGRSAFKDYDPEGLYKFYMYVWVLSGGGNNLSLIHI